eukprot:COSAG02_NODE_7673_length_2900_cov_42.670475_2_plen_67_part_00
MARHGRFVPVGVGAVPAFGNGFWGGNVGGWRMDLAQQVGAETMQAQVEALSAALVGTRVILIVCGE